MTFKLSHPHLLAKVEPKPTKAILGASLEVPGPGATVGRPGEVVSGVVLISFPGRPAWTPCLSHIVATSSEHEGSGVSVLCHPQGAAASSVSP